MLSEIFVDGGSADRDAPQISPRGIGDRVPGML
jgi:hypothetical protein